MVEVEPRKKSKFFDYDRSPAKALFLSTKVHMKVSEAIRQINQGMKRQKELARKRKLAHCMLIDFGQSVRDNPLTDLPVPQEDGWLYNLPSAAGSSILAGATASALIPAYVKKIAPGVDEEQVQAAGFVLGSLPPAFHYTRKFLETINDNRIKRDAYNIAKGHLDALRGEDGKLSVRKVNKTIRTVCALYNAADYEIGRLRDRRENLKELLKQKFSVAEARGLLEKFKAEEDRGGRDAALSMAGIAAQVVRIKKQTPSKPKPKKE